jgi:phosphoglucosamine mutase
LYFSCSSFNCGANACSARIDRICLIVSGRITIRVTNVRAMIDAQKQLKELTEGFQQYPQILLNVRVREKVPFAELTGVQKVVSQVEEQLSQNGRLLLRYSGTEPLARVMIEGAKQSEIESYATQIAEEIRKEIGV